MKKIFSMLMAITMFMCVVGFVPVSAYTYDKQNESEVRYNISYYSDGGVSEKAMIVRSVDELPHSEISLEKAVTPYCDVMEIPSEPADGEVVSEYDGNDTPPKRVITIDPPTVNIESGEVPYGSEITISPTHSNDFVYFVNGEMFINSRLTQGFLTDAVITVTENTVLVVRSMTDVIEPDTEYVFPEVTYTYTIGGSVVPPNKHVHKICGDEDCTDNHEEIEWTAWDSDTLLPTEAGNYYLTKDIDLSEMWCPETAVNLCFNGHIVSCDWYRGSPDSAMVFYGLTDTIILTDCSDTEHKFSVGDRGNWVLDENGTKMLKGGAVINPNGYFAIRAFDTSVNMYNINITGSWGGILADTLNMYNCTLAGNYDAEAMGIGNTANIRDCSIFENTGGGVFTGNGALNISGRILIKDNRSNLYIYNADAVNIVGSLAEGSYIGVNKYADENVINVTSANDADYSGFFCSDDENYKIVNGENNIIQLVYDKDSKAYPYTVTEITIFDSLGSKVSYIPKNKEGYAIGINVHKNAESDKDVFIICALYDKDGALMGVYPAKMQSSPEIIQYHEEIPAQEKVAGSIKVFVWDGCNSMKPLTEAKTMSFMGQ